MPTDAYLDDVFTLVDALSREDITRAVLEAAPPAEHSTEVVIEVYLREDELRAAIAFQQALQLSVDAAATIVESSVRGIEPGRDLVETVVGERFVELIIIDLGSGSFFGRFKIDPRTKDGRTRILAIAGVTVAGLTLASVLPPAAPLIIGGIGSLATILTPDALPSDTVPLKTVDGDDVDVEPKMEIRASDGSAEDEPRVPAEQRKVFVYDVDLDGLKKANDDFLARVHELPSVEAQSRFITVNPGELPRIRIWSSEPLDEAQLAESAASAGTRIARVQQLYD